MIMAYVWSLATGIVTAGLVASFYRLITKKPPSFQMWQVALRPSFLQDHLLLCVMHCVRRLLKTAHLSGLLRARFCRVSGAFLSGFLFWTFF